MIERRFVYLLWHSRELGEGETDDKLIGIYDSGEAAEAARVRKLDFEGFRDWPESFLIDRYEVNRDAWSEGFVTVCPNENHGS
ncbi:hypothetical protein U1839_26005 [Sphingomonas sp. RT2P30]|uniref:DUF7336 domain-containing protein n=1 Tax=Parasphingomonas halimpatiens TaxID=3096162 RepID=UPI002FC6F9B6